MNLPLEVHELLMRAEVDRSGKVPLGDLVYHTVLSMVHIGLTEVATMFNTLGHVTIVEDDKFPTEELFGLNEEETEETTTTEEG